MNTVYVLMEEGWEYNDETYFNPESGSDNPVKVFLTKDGAQQECDRRNAQSIRELFTSGEANQYFWNIKDIMPYSEKKNTEYMAKIKKSIEKIFSTDIDGLNEKIEQETDIEVSDDITDNDWLEFQSLVNLNFWDVVEVESE